MKVILGDGTIINDIIENVDFKINLDKILFDIIFAIKTNNKEKFLETRATDTSLFRIENLFLTDEEATRYYEWCKYNVIEFIDGEIWMGSHEMGKYCEAFEGIEELFGYTGNIRRIKLDCYKDDVLSIYNYSYGNKMKLTENIFRTIHILKPENYGFMRQYEIDIPVDELKLISDKYPDVAENLKIHCPAYLSIFLK